MSVFEQSEVTSFSQDRSTSGAAQFAAAVIDQIECALLVCDASGQMLHANRAARRELASGVVLMLQEGSVRCAGRNQAELAAAIQAAATRQLRRLLSIGDRERLMLVAMPLDVGRDGHPLALLMISRRTVCSPLGLELLAIQHRLTYTEQRVLRALIARHAVRDIAKDHGVAVSTVRTQIQAIRSKIGVDNIDTLLLTAAQVPPVTAWH